MTDFQTAEPQTIQVYFVKFNPPSPLLPMFSFIFNPSRLTLPNLGGNTPTTYQVTFELTSNIPGVTISMIDNVPGTEAPPGLEVSDLNTASPTITFNNQGLTVTDPYHYRITIQVPGASLPFTSDDPELEIPPPS